MLSRRLIVGLAAAALALLVLARGAAGAPDCTITWDGGAGTGSWHAPENWDTDAVPAASDHVCIPAGSTSAPVEFTSGDVSVLTLTAAEPLSVDGGILRVTDTDNASVVADVLLQGGSLGGAGTWRLTGAMDWAGGSLADTGRFEIAASGAVNVAAGFQVFFERELVNAGSMTVGGSLFALGESRLENSGSIALPDGADLVSTSFPQRPQLLNSGTLTKSGASTSTIQMALLNTGTVSAQAGRLSLIDTDAGAHHGAFAAAPAATLELATSTPLVLGSGATLSGHVEVNGVVDVDAGVTVPIADLRLEAGSLGGPGTWRVTGTLDWAGGSLADAGRFEVAGSGVVNVAPGFQGVFSRELVNAGSIAVAGGSLFATSGSRLENSGSIALPGGADLISTSFPERPQLLNTGTIGKTGATASAIQMALLNTGTVSAEAGRLSIADVDPGAQHGSFAAAPGATLELATFTPFLLGSGATLSGQVEVNGLVDVAEGVTVVVADTLRLEAGALGGPGTWRVTGALDWVGGTLADTGRFEVAGSGVVNLDPGFQGVFARELVNAGSIVVAGGSLFATSGSRLENSGTIALSDGADLISTSFPTRPPLVNSGTIAKTGATGSVIQLALLNTGMVKAQAGRLSIADVDGRPQHGPFQAAPGATLELATSTPLLLGSGATLSGQVEVNGLVEADTGVAVVVADPLRLESGSLGGPGTWRLTGGLDWVGGTLVEGGRFEIAPAGALSVAPGFQGVFARDVVNAGSITVAGGSLFGVGGSRLENSGTIALTDGADLISTSFPTRPPLVNSGTIAKSGASLSSIQMGLLNSGTISAQAGRLSIGGVAPDAEQPGTFAAQPGAVIALESFEELLLGDGATLAGHAELGGSVAVADGATAVATGPVELVSGYIGGPGSLRITDELQWLGGMMSGSGTTEIARAASFTLDVPFSTVSLDGRSLALKGDMAWKSGSIHASNGAAIRNSGTLTLEGDLALTASTPGFGGVHPLLYNTGTLRKTAGTGVASIFSTVDNDGSIEVESGRLGLLGPLMGYSSRTGSLTGGQFVARNATLALAAGGLRINAAALVLDGEAAELLDQFEQPLLGQLERNAAGGQLRLTGGVDLGVPGGFTNAGLLVLDAASTFAAAGPFVQTAGETRLGAASARLESGVAPEVAGGRIGGIGAVAPGLTVSGGQLSPGGASAGTLHVEGPYAQAAGGVLRIDVAGAAAADRVEAAGAATLGGALRVVRAPGADPPPGSSFEIVSAASRSGEFATVDAPGFELAYEPAGVRVGVPAQALSIAAEAPGPAASDAPAAGTGAPVDVARRSLLDDRELEARGAWRRADDPDAQGGSVMSASQRGATLVARDVSARRVALVVRRCPRCGTVRVRWNGRFVRTLRLRAARRRDRQVVTVLRLPRVERGTLRVRVVSRGRPVTIDGVALSMR